MLLNEARERADKFVRLRKQMHEPLVFLLVEQLAITLLVLVHKLKSKWMLIVATRRQESKFAPFAYDPAFSSPEISSIWALNANSHNIQNFG